MNRLMDNVMNNFIDNVLDNTDRIMNDSTGNFRILLVIVVMALVTMLLRFLPFLIFDHGEKLPAWISYLGKVLPPAIMSMLLVYCIRNINLLQGNHGLPELLCVGVAMLLHAWKRNTLLSIGVSTILYMVLVQNFF
ncbi:MAG: branched-chain amino acid transporter permease [Lachnospiraceae bacterium]